MPFGVSQCHMAKRNPVCIIHVHQCGVIGGLCQDNVCGIAAFRSKGDAECIRRSWKIFNIKCLLVFAGPEFECDMIDNACKIQYRLQFADQVKVRRKTTNGVCTGQRGIKCSSGQQVIFGFSISCIIGHLRPCINIVGDQLLKYKTSDLESITNCRREIPGPFKRSLLYPIDRPSDRC